MMLSVRSMLVALISVSALAPAPVLAGRAVDCKHPVAFPGSSVNVMVHIRGVEERHTEAANKLTALIELHTLFGNLDFGSIAVNALVRLEGPCPAPEEMIAQLLGPGTSIREGNGLIMLEGSIHEDDQGLFLRTSLRFFRQGVEERRSVVIGAGEQRVSLDVRPPFQRVALPVRRLTHEDLASIIKHYERVAVLHPRPKDEGSGTPIPIEPIGYTVGKRDGAWMFIEPFGRASGWIRVGDVSKRAFLWEKLPELDLLRGILGYLRVRIESERQPPPSERVLSGMRAAAREALDSYLASQRESGPNRPRALAHALAASLEWTVGDADAASFAKTRAGLERAVRLVPTNGNLQNALAVAKLAECETGDSSRDCFARTLPAFERAMIAAPRNVQVLTNTRRIYQGLEVRQLERETPDDEKLERENVRSAIERLDRALAIEEKDGAKKEPPQ